MLNTTDKDALRFELSNALRIELRRIIRKHDEIRQFSSFQRTNALLGEAETERGSALCDYPFAHTNLCPPSIWMVSTVMNSLAMR